MWFPFALLSAFFYALLWTLGRASRGMPTSVVTAMQFIAGPFLLLSVTQTIDYPWGEWWWKAYLFLPLFFLPLTFFAMTSALHATQVTLVKPLFGLSSIATLIVASSFFGEEVTRLGVLGIAFITLGLFVLYHGRWHAWREAGPWMVLLGAIIFGTNAAILAAVLKKFPHVLAIAAIIFTGSFVWNLVFSLREWGRMRWSRKHVIILLGLILSCTGQDLVTMYAFTLGPSPYVIAVKRTSVLMTAFLGYVFLHERDQSLLRLLLSASLVVLGVIALTLH
jgi:drug/metabolite transporter (DMT)-like permease